jgi:hypothetical protein
MRYIVLPEAAKQVLNAMSSIDVSPQHNKQHRVRHVSKTAVCLNLKAFRDALSPFCRNLQYQDS